MADVFTASERSRVMAAVRARGNKATELRLIAIFRQFGIKGWRRHQPLPGLPDFVFGKARLAVFVDGCFWHGCPKHCRMPQSNAEDRQRKIQRNAARDRSTNRKLRLAGWRVLRVWGHALKPAESVAQRVLRQLARPRATSPIETAYEPSSHT